MYQGVLWGKHPGDWREHGGMERHPQTGSPPPRSPPQANFSPASMSHLHSCLLQHAEPKFSKESRQPALQGKLCPWYPIEVFFPHPGPQTKLLRVMFIYSLPYLLTINPPPFPVALGAKFSLLPMAVVLNKIFLCIISVWWIISL